MSLLADQTPAQVETGSYGGNRWSTGVINNLNYAHVPLSAPGPGHYARFLTGMAHCDTCYSSHLCFSSYSMRRQIERNPIT